MDDAQCTGKLGYKSKVSAGKSIESMRKRGSLRGKIQVYKCTLCAMYHIGATFRRKGERVYG